MKLDEYYNKLYAEESNEIPDIAFSNFPKSRFEAVVKYFPELFRGGEILELGAGNGMVAKKLLSILDVHKYIAGDLSSPRIENLKIQLNDKRLVTQQIDAEKDIGKFERESFDAIVEIALIEHLVDPIQHLKEINRILKKGGFVYLDTPNIAKYTARIKLLFGRFPSTASIDEGTLTYNKQPVDLHDEGHLHYFTYRSLEKLLVQYCGFNKVIRLGYSGGFEFLGNKMHYYLARLYPSLFSELVLVAYK